MKFEKDFTSLKKIPNVFKSETSIFELETNNDYLAYNKEIKSKFQNTRLY